MVDQSFVISACSKVYHWKGEGLCSYFSPPGINRRILDFKRRRWFKINVNFNSNGTFKVSSKGRTENQGKYKFYNDTILIIDKNCGVKYPGLYKTLFYNDDSVRFKVGHIEIVKLLIAEGANPNLASNNQFKVSPIHSACAISAYDIASILIENGADVNVKQMRGYTPLHSAAHNGQTELVKLLIDNGADVNAETVDGHTPGHLAEAGKFYKTSELIKRSAAQ